MLAGKMHFRRRGAEAGTAMLRQNVSFYKEGALDLSCVGLDLAFKKDTNYEEFINLQGSLSCSLLNACQACTKGVWGYMESRH